MKVDRGSSHLQGCHCVKSISLQFGVQLTAVGQLLYLPVRLTGRMRRSEPALGDRRSQGGIAGGTMVL